MTKLPATPTTVIRPEWYMTFEKVSISVYFGFCTTWDWWGDCPGHCSKLAPVLMDYQYLFIQLFFVPNISLFVYNQLYLLWISFLFTQIVASIYPRACAITFPQLGKFGKNKEKCMPPHFNVFQLLRDKYESNTLQIFIEYRTNDNWIHAKYELTTHKKTKCTKRKVLPTSKAEHFPHFGGFVRP